MAKKERIQVVEDFHLNNVIEGLVDIKKPEFPFQIYYIDNIIERYKTWKRLLPRVIPHYAIKCNDHALVIKLMVALGLGFDCASKKEIQKVLTWGVDPKRIIFANTIKPLHHISYARKVNVDLTTFDNKLELYKIKKVFPTARTVIRIRCNADATINLSLKFGCDAYTEAKKLLILAKELNIQVVGVSFHVGWNCKDPSTYYEAIKASRFVFDLGSAVGFNFNLLDLGGGFPGDSGTSLKQYANSINSALSEFFPEASIRVISEPGTYFVHSAFTLASSIISIKETRENSLPKYMYYLNDGTFGSLSSVIYTNDVKVPYPVKHRDSQTYPSVVWGPTLDSTDLIIKDILLPRMQFGDWVFFTDVGAYSLPLMTNFNSLECPRIYTVISRKSWLMLKNKAPFTEDDFIQEIYRIKEEDVDKRKYLIHFRAKY